MPSRRDVLKLVGTAFVPNVLAHSPRPSGPRASRLPELLERGKPEVFSGDELKYVGMPIGGCFAGTVYIGGDGKLWNWDILNQPHEGAVARKPVVFSGQTLRERDGANYVEPPEQQSEFETQFSINGKPLDHRGDWKITFAGQYPVATITYENEDFEIDLTALSPFVPLQIEQSSYPAVMMRYSVKCKNASIRSAVIECVFEHPGMIHSEKSARGKTIEEKKAGQWTGLFASCHEPLDPAAYDFGDFTVIAQRGTTDIPHNTSLPVGKVQRELKFSDGRRQEATFLLAWNFPNTNLDGPLKGQKRWYASRWKDSFEVAADLIPKLASLTKTTLRWRDTWYDSSLPHWFLNRTMIPLATLATNTCYRFADGRFWFWEGVGCCAGTCTHVWSYAQAIAYIFPSVEQSLRKDIDFGMAFQPNGVINYRAEFGQHIAHDGQCGCILRTYREHLNSPDSAFLASIFPHVKKAMQALMDEDKDHDGLLEGSQYNSLDAAWYGPMAWISSLFIAALRASAEMATVMKDFDFSAECTTRADAGTNSMAEKLFNGEYFIHIPDPTHPEANATGIGCHIDQLYGQTWTDWLGIPSVVSHDKAKTALAALFKNNFYQQVGSYRRQSKVQGGRWYAMPDESGLVMTTFPKGGSERATGAGRDAWAAMYFNECMTGFEYQAASCMIAEGLVEEGLTVIRAIHDRYSPRKRNPYNEIECSDHYGRAMASFGGYLALTGWQSVNGKEPEFKRSKVKNLKCAFVSPKGWGTYENGKYRYAYRITKVEK